MLLSVQDQFVPKIQDGTKPLSIRAFRKDGRIPKPGEKIFMYHGSRYAKGKRPRVFPQGMEPTVSFVGKIVLYTKTDFTPNAIRIYYNGYDMSKIKNIGIMFDFFSGDGAEIIGTLELGKFAQMDGFNCFADQLAFFEKYHGLPFSGLIIFWKLHPEYLRRRNAGQ